MTEPNGNLSSPVDGGYLSSPVDGVSFSVGSQQEIDIADWVPAEEITPAEDVEQFHELCPDGKGWTEPIEVWADPSYWTNPDHPAKAEGADLRAFNSKGELKEPTVKESGT